MTEQNLDIYSSRDYKRSRAAYALECTFEYFVALLVSDAYLANLLRYMGISDPMIVIISSLISFAFLFQLLSLFAVKHIVNVKRASIIFHFASQLFFMSMFLIPFTPLGTEYKTVAVIACVLVAYLGNYLVTSVIFKWGMSYVDPHKRASYGATKEMISLISGMVFTLVVGFALDRFTESGNIEGGFVFIAVGILVCSLIDLICLLLIKTPKAEKTEQKNEPLSSVLKKLFKNKAFLCLLVVGVLMYVSQYIINSSMGAYKTGELGFSIGEIQVINTVGVLFRFAISKPLGRFSDKTSYCTGLILGFSVLSLCFLLNVFCAPSTRWMIYVYTLLYNGAQAAIHQNFLNITFDYVESEYFVQATSIKAAIGGVCGFLATLGGAALLSTVQANGNSFMGVDMYAQQLLSAVACVVSLVLVAFVALVLRKQKHINE